ncbi:MAG: hypothetical protein AAF915_19635 [Cyanobacteria bacterium P01_D01_bin.50]
MNYTDLEVEAILSYFPSHQVLPKKQATKAALSVPLVLNQAQLWLRDVCVEDLLEWSKKSQFNQNIQQEMKEELELHKPSEKRFSSPVHWAAFCVVGQ